MLCPGRPGASVPWLDTTSRARWPSSRTASRPRRTAGGTSWRARWPDGFRCPRRGAREAYEVAGRELLQCRACRHQASVTAGTVLHRTHVPLRLWFAAAYLITTHTPGFSAVQLQRQLGLARYETAWTMLHKLRRAMLRPERDRLSGVVEVDEAYVGGLEEGRRGGGRRDSGKSIVVGAVEVRGRGSGRVRLAVVRDLSAASLVPFVEASVDPGSTVLTDGWQGYAPLRERYDHRPSTVGDPRNASRLLPRVHRTFSNLKTWLSLTLHVSEGCGRHAWIQKNPSEAMNARASSSGMTTGPKSPGAPQASRRHHATWTRSPSPVGRSRATGPPVRRLYSV